MNFKCNNCGYVFEQPTSVCGTQISCAKCGAEFVARPMVVIEDDEDDAVVLAPASRVCGADEEDDCLVLEPAKRPGDVQPSDVRTDEDGDVLVLKPANSDEVAASAQEQVATTENTAEGDAIDNAMDEASAEFSVKTRAEISGVDLADSVVADAEDPSSGIVRETMEEVEVAAVGPTAVDPSNLKIGKVVRKMFPIAFAEGRVTQADIDFLMSSEAVKYFKTGGYQVIKLVIRDPEDEARDSKGLNRYYPKFTLDFDGKRYILTSQWFAKAMPNVLEWLAKHGIDAARVVDVVKPTPDVAPVSASVAVAEEAAAVAEEPVAEATEANVEAIAEEPQEITAETPAETVECPLQDPPSGDYELKIGKTAQKMFPIVFAEGRVNQEDVDWLLSDAAVKYFKTAGYKVLMEMTTDPVTDSRDAAGSNRYYPKFTLPFGGKQYLLTSQWYKNGLQNLLEWLEKHGISTSRVVELCAKPVQKQPEEPVAAVEAEQGTAIEADVITAVETIDASPKAVEEDPMRKSKANSLKIKGAHPLTEAGLSEIVTPKGMLIDGKPIRPSYSWKDCYLSLCEKLQSMDQALFDTLPENPLFKRFFIRLPSKKTQECYTDRFGSKEDIRVKEIASKSYFFMPTYVVQNLLRLYKIDPSRVQVLSVPYQPPAEPVGPAPVEGIDVPMKEAHTIKISVAPTPPDPPELDPEPVVEPEPVIEPEPVAMPETVVETPPDPPVVEKEQPKDDPEPVAPVAPEPVVVKPPVEEEKVVPAPEESPMKAKAVVVYGSMTGNTEAVALKIAAKLGVEAVNVAQATAENFAADTLILGTSTCAGEIQDDWKEGGLTVLDGLDLAGKKVAIFGTGDAVNFDSSYGAGMATLARKALERGAALVGKVAASEYGEAPISYIKCDGDAASTFGLLLDMENESDSTDEKIADWTSKIKL